MHNELGDLDQMVRQLRYKTGWSFRLAQGATSGMFGCDQGQNLGAPVSSGSGYTVFLDEIAFLIICLETEDNLNRGKRIHVEHRFLVPYPKGFVVPWHRWLLDCIRQVETHEMCEAFEVGGQRPYFPEHGPKADMYRIKDRGLEWPPTPTTRTA